jgi:hypothetical protein
VTDPLRLDPQQGLVRVVRAGVLTVPAVGFAAFAHASVDRCVSVVAVLLAVSVCWPAAVVLLGAQRRIPALLGWLVVAQGVTHLLLEQLCVDAGPGPSGLVEHLMIGISPDMLAMHAGSVIFTAVLFGRADAGLWTARAVVRAGARALRRIGAPVLPVGLPRVYCTAGASTGKRRPQVLWEAGAPQRRGPPALLAS